MRNGCVARDLARRQGARRENIPGGSSTDEQRRRRAKDRQPCGRFSGGRLAALLLSHRALAAMLLRRALPDARRKTAHPFLIYYLALKPLDAPAAKAVEVIVREITVGPDHPSGQANSRPEGLIDFGSYLPSNMTNWL